MLIHLFILFRYNIDEFVKFVEGSTNKLTPFPFTIEFLNLTDQFSRRNTSANISTIFEGNLLHDRSNDKSDGKDTGSMHSLSMRERLQTQILADYDVIIDTLADVPRELIRFHTETKKLFNDDEQNDDTSDETFDNVDKSIKSKTTRQLLVSLMALSMRENELNQVKE